MIIIKSPQGGSRSMSQNAAHIK